ncbi:hypothetical protein SESBI_01252 [Sesbania bispinosa]|nr:hypothetical protein SESBI_01252 [Sesbania bispinosa]
MALCSDGGAERKERKRCCLWMALIATQICAIRCGEERRLPGTARRMTMAVQERHKSRERGARRLRLTMAKVKEGIK